MANFLEQKNCFKIFISGWKNIDNVTFYVLRIELGDVKWTVDRRYSEFAVLHQNLVSSHGVSVDILPPKKVIGNRDEQFIGKRLLALEIYIQTVVQFLQETVPRSLAIFLNFDKYDIHFIVKSLAVKLFQIGERVLSKGKQYSFTVLEVYAINERLKQPCSNLDLTDQMEDFSHVLDFCYQLVEITIIGDEIAVGDSNIYPNELTIQLSIFKALRTLTLKNIALACVNDLGLLRSTLKTLSIINCKVGSLTELLLCDQMHKILGNRQYEWTSLTTLSISDTPFYQFDNSIQLIPNIRSINMLNNRMIEISPVTSIYNLSHLTVSRNLLKGINDFEAINLTYLDLSENQITSLKPFQKLFRLISINLQINKIHNVDEISYISDIQSLENIVLTGNPVSRIVDYRVKVLEHFGPRAFRICLDNECTNQKELDKANILRALNKQKFSGEHLQPRRSSSFTACTQLADEVT